LSRTARRPGRPRARFCSTICPSGFGPWTPAYDSKEHDPSELCLCELPDRGRTLAWDDLLYGGWDSYPDAVPAHLSTKVCGRARVGSGELRAVEVYADDEDWVSMAGGWPYGRRPAKARRPAPAHPAK
jgi:hypothetical protein